MTEKLTRDFFEQPTLLVAEKLIGKRMVFAGFKGIITETEAYVAQDDPACHAFRGMTPRTKVLFGPAGWSYVYFIYGMYHCLNFVTEPNGTAAAVLIRGLKLTEPSSLILDGPGKICRHLGITREHNCIDIVNSDFFYVENTDIVLPFQITPRIGISQAKDKLWRYVVDVKALRALE